MANPPPFWVNDMIFGQPLSTHWWFLLKTFIWFHIWNGSTDQNVYFYILHILYPLTLPRQDRHHLQTSHKYIASPLVAKCHFQFQQFELLNHAKFFFILSSINIINFYVFIQFCNIHCCFSDSTLLLGIPLKNIFVIYGSFEIA